MTRILVLALGLMMVPALASAQLEIGLDGGFTYAKDDGATDAVIGIGLPTSGARLGFAAGPQMTIETRLGLDWQKSGDASASALSLLPGLNYMITPQVYLRGEAGLTRFSFDDGAGTSGSALQYIFGGAVGMRRALGSGALLRLEAGADQALENADDFVPANLSIHATVGVSAVVGG